MAVVNDEDRECAGLVVQCFYVADNMAVHVAVYRERIEARKDAQFAAGRDGRIAELEAQLGKWRSFADGLLRTDPVPGDEPMRDGIRKLLAAAKPVLTADEQGTVAHARSGASDMWRDLAAIIDRLCPPPKAPPSDAELAKLALDTAERIATGSACDALRSIGEALRARGAK